jgi:hypothetical protein
MKLWIRLYLTVWVAFFSCVLIPRWMDSTIATYLHIALGVVLLILTLSNARSLTRVQVPARLKRISKVTACFAIFQILCGLAWGAVVHFIPDKPTVQLILNIVHVVLALAILAQSSSVATAYDMWEEKEFES